MIGNWKGYYNFENEKIQKIRGFEKTYFEIIIEKFDGEIFSGTVKEDTKSGGMEEIGKIIGKVEDNNISFEKLMPKRTQINSKGELKNIEGKHPVLYYIGTLSENKTEVVGTWKFKKRMGLLFGIIPVFFRPGNGNWKMNLS
jgi:hypothetical protein